MRWLVGAVAVALASCEEPPSEVYRFEVSVSAGVGAPASVDILYDGVRLEWRNPEGSAPSVASEVLLGDVAQRSRYIGNIVVMRGGQQLSARGVAPHCMPQPSRPSVRPISEAQGFRLDDVGQLVSTGSACGYEDGTRSSIIID